jgi:hypothetical protein
MVWTNLQKINSEEKTLKPIFLQNVPVINIKILKVKSPLGISYICSTHFKEYIKPSPQELLSSLILFRTSYDVSTHSDFNYKTWLFEVY